MSSPIFKTFVALLAIIGIFTFCASSANADFAIANCGAWNVDLSPLASADIIGNVSGYSYIIRPCGVISESVCVADSSANTSSVCQHSTTSTQAYALAIWNNSAVSYTRSRYSLFQELDTGESCNGSPRKSNIEYRCNASATTPFISGVAENYTCQYSLIVQTSLTCSLTQEANCTFDGIDLNPMFAQGELNYTSTYRWFVRMCASAPVNSNCSNDTTSYDSMVCQQRLDYSDNFNIATYNEQTVQWASVPTGSNAGLQITVINGEYCSAITANRRAIIQLVCDPTLSYGGSYIYAVSEVQTCHYQITIRTAFSCAAVRTTSSSTGGGVALSSSWWPDANGATDCYYNGYNFTSLYRQGDLTYAGYVGSIYYNFYFHMCGTVNNSQCKADSSTYNSQFCMASATNNEDNYALDYYVTSDWTWTTTSNGTYYTSTAGELCGTTYRTTTVEFQCVSNATNSTINSLSYSTNSCNFHIVIYTSAVCGSQVFYSSSSSSSSSTAISTTATVASSSASAATCYSSASDVPDGSAALNFVFNVDASSLASNFSSVLSSTLSNLFSTNQLACGPVFSNGTITNVNSTSKTVVVTYVVPGSASVSSIVNTISNTATNSPSTINSALPSGSPSVYSYNSVSCSSGYYPDSTTGSCVERDSGSSGLSDGAIAGIVVGSVVGGLLIIAIIICLICRSGKSSNSGRKDVEMTTA